MLIRKSFRLLLLIAPIVVLSGCSLFFGSLVNKFQRNLSIGPIVVYEQGPYFLYDFDEDSIPDSGVEIQEEVAEIKREPRPVEIVKQDESSTELEKFEKSVGDYWVYYDERLLSKCTQLDPSLVGRIPDYEAFYKNQMLWEKFNNSG